MAKAQSDVDLSFYNTFKVSAKAKYFIELNTLDDLADLPREKTLILGQGANILFTKDFEGLVIKNNLLGKKDLGEGVFEVGAGESWIDLVTWTTENGWSGIENLAYIPGSVGAAPVQNIAAYGQNFGEIVISVTGFNLETNKIETLSKQECKLYYRDSIFKHELKNKFLVSSVKFRLSKIAKFDTHYYGSRPYESLQAQIDKISKPPYTPKIIAQAVTNQRIINLPDWKVFGTAGSFFKNPFVSKEKLSEIQKRIPNIQVYPITAMTYPNPDDPALKMADRVKVPAGKLLDELEWKGKRIGNVGTYEKHALTVVNYGGASGQEILDFTSQMQADVKKNFDINLEPEVNII